MVIRSGLFPRQHLEDRAVLRDKRPFLHEEEDACGGRLQHLPHGAVRRAQQEGELFAAPHVRASELHPAQQPRRTGGNLRQVFLRDYAGGMPWRILAADDAAGVEEADDGAQRLLRGGLVDLVRLARVQGEGLRAGKLPEL